MKLRARPQQQTSPLLSRRRSSREHHTYNPNGAASTSGGGRRASKTLPRGFSLQSASGNELSSLDCDVFGLYGELLNVRDYDCDSGEIAARNAVRNIAFHRPNGDRLSKALSFRTVVSFVAPIPS